MSQLDLSTLGINEKIQKIATIARKHKLGNEGFNSVELINESLPPEVTMESIDAALKYISDVTVATKAVSGEMSADSFVKDKNLNRTKHVIKIGSNAVITHTHNRTKEVNNPATQEKSTRYLSGTSKVTLSGTKNSAASMKKIITNLDKLGQSLLNN